MSHDQSHHPTSAEPGAAREPKSGLPDPQTFTEDWLRAWNAHDVDGVLAHFHDRCTFSSPVAIRAIGGDGVLRGKEAVRGYWTRALALVPDLHFDLVGVYAGVSSLVINYRNQRGGLVNEVLIFDGGLVVEGYGTYLDAGDNPAGLSASAG